MTECPAVNPWRCLALLAALLVTPAHPAFCEEQEGPEGVAAAHFHHVHLNVTDPEATLEFYQRYLGATEVLYRGLRPALFTERSFLLLNEVDEPPRTGPKTAISHIGWGGVTGQAEYDWLKSQGVEFQTPIGRLGNNYGMYFYGPDRELIEIWTGGKHHRFDHIHLWATDVETSTGWFEKHLGLEARVGPKPASKDPVDISSIWMSFLRVDNVNMVFFGRPDFESVWWPGSNYSEEDGPPGDFQPTRGHVVDHLAFSYLDIRPVHRRMQEAGARIVQDIQRHEDYGFDSFFVLAPDDLLVEIVQEPNIPEEIWAE